VNGLVRTTVPEPTCQSEAFRVVVLHPLLAPKRSPTGAVSPNVPVGPPRRGPPCRAVSPRDGDCLGAVDSGSELTEVRPRMVEQRPASDRKALRLILDLHSATSPGISENQSSLSRRSRPIAVVITRTRLRQGYQRLNVSTTPYRRLVGLSSVEC